MALSVTHTFVDLTTAEAAEVNQNFTDITANALDKRGDTMTGALLFSADNAHDIGASGATRPRDLFLGRDLILENTTNANQKGIVFKSAALFIHNFEYGDNGTVTPLGDNTFVGEGAGNLTMGSTATATFEASRNTSVGHNTLASNTLGFNNMALGDLALTSNTIGGRNVAIGSDVLKANTTGDNNMALGEGSMLKNIGGGGNTALGQSTLTENISGGENVAIGRTALKVNTTATGNIGIGFEALFTTQTGAFNVGVGYRSLRLTTVSSNTAFGSFSLTAVSTGTRNIGVGYEAGDNLTTGSNNLFLGYSIDAQSVSASNQMSIGNLIFSEGLDGTGTTISSGNIGIAHTTPAAKLHIDQHSTTGARPVILLDQADVDEDYFKFIGTSDTSADRALVDAANFTTPGAIVGWLKINVQDDQSTAPIPDGDYYMPFYAVPTA